MQPSKFGRVTHVLACELPLDGLRRDGSRFDARRQLMAYPGLVRSELSSGA